MYAPEIWNLEFGTQMFNRNAQTLRLKRSALDSVVTTVWETLAWDFEAKFLARGFDTIIPESADLF